MTVDAVDVALERDVAAAKKSLLAVSHAEPERWWTAFDLKTRARNGWTGSTMGLALYELLDEDCFERQSDLRLRARRDG
jgi:hypothetical protein